MIFLYTKNFECVTKPSDCVNFRDVIVLSKVFKQTTSKVLYSNTFILNVMVYVKHFLVEKYYNNKCKTSHQ